MLPLFQMENGQTHYTPAPSLPSCPEGAHSEIDDSALSDDSTEVDDSVVAEDPFSEGASIPSFLPSLLLDDSDPDGLPDQTVNQIELFFSSRFCRVNVCQCHATVTSNELDQPTKGILCLQSFLDTQLPTQVQSAKLLLCMPKTFHVMWAMPLFVDGPNATALTEADDVVQLGAARLQLRGTAARRTKFLTDLRIALQKLRIHVSQDKSARKKAIKAYKKERKGKGKVTKKNISIPCEFAHVTQLTNQHLSVAPQRSVNGQAASSRDSAFSTGSLYA